MTHKKVQLLTMASVAGWLLALVVPAAGLMAVRIEVLILVNMVVLSAAITCTVLTVIARCLPPVAAAWFLGYREATKREPDRDDSRLRIV